MNQYYSIKINNKLSKRTVEPDKWKLKLDTNGQSNVSISWIGHMEASSKQFYCNFTKRTDYCLQYTIKGRGYFFTNNKFYNIEKGTLWLIPKEQYYYYASDEKEPYEYYWMHLGGKSVEDFLMNIGLTEEHPVIPNMNNPNIKLQFENLISNINKENTNSHLLLSFVHLLMYEIESSMVENNNHHSVKPSDNDSERVIAYIKEHYKEDLSLQDLADIALLEKSYFIKKFKKLTNTTPTQFLINYRISQACILLKTDQKLREIALNCGFNDFTNFLQMFKKVTKITPTQYRKVLAMKY